MRKTKTFKQLACKLCGDIVPKVDADATAITCWQCVSKMLSGIVVTCEDPDPDSSNKKD